MTITPEALERLKACPFCGGEAEIVHLDDGENTGGSCVSCTQCLASGNVEFGRKENFVANWNRRTPGATLEATQAENVRLREALEQIDLLDPLEINPNNYNHDDVCELNFNAAKASVIARQALSTSGERS